MNFDIIQPTGIYKSTPYGYAWTCTTWHHLWRCHWCLYSLFIPATREIHVRLIILCVLYCQRLSDCMTTTK